MKKIIYYFVVLIIIIVIPYFYSCKGSDTVTGPQNSDCGNNHVKQYGTYYSAQSTSTILDTGNTRVFRFSAIPYTSIDNICTKGAEPTFTGDATWFHGRGINCVLVAVVSLVYQPYTTPGAITIGVINDFWSGSESVGLQQQYGNGPGSIIDLRIEARFHSFGTLAQDQHWLDSADFRCDMSINYNDYKP